MRTSGGLSPRTTTTTLEATVSNLSVAERLIDRAFAGDGRVEAIARRVLALLAQCRESHRRDVLERHAKNMLNRGA